MSEYETGRVYSGVVAGERVTLMRQDVAPLATDPDRYWCGARADYADADNQVTDLRPLVVLDLADIPAIDAPTAVKVLLNELRDLLGGDRAEWLADQIEAQTKPPRPEEPTGLGAVVVDMAETGDLRWTRTSGPSAPRGAAMWIAETGESRDWASFRRPVVKSAGLSE